MVPVYLECQLDRTIYLIDCCGVVPATARKLCARYQLRLVQNRVQSPVYSPLITLTRKSSEYAEHLLRSIDIIT